jgi:hypothetical protein
MALGNLKALVPRALNIPSCHNLPIMPLILSIFLKSAVKVLSSWYEQLKVHFTI